jgi:hypothetical protein
VSNTSYALYMHIFKSEKDFYLHKPLSCLLFIWICPSFLCLKGAFSASPFQTLQGDSRHEIGRWGPQLDCIGFICHESSPLRLIINNADLLPAPRVLANVCRWYSRSKTSLASLVPPLMHLGQSTSQSHGQCGWWESPSVQKRTF